MYSAHRHDHIVCMKELVLKYFCVILFMSAATTVVADHVIATQSSTAFEEYQHVAAKKRYADILKIADLIEEYVETTGSMPQLDSFIIPSTKEESIYEVAIVGQSSAVRAVFQNGTPFDFSLKKFKPKVLHDVLSSGLSRPLVLPIDPQRVGTNFAPVYFVFFRRALKDSPARYIVLGTFAQPVTHSTMVAEGVHIVAISNVSAPFIVPVQLRDSFDAKFVSHVFEEGKDADAVFFKVCSYWHRVTVSQQDHWLRNRDSTHFPVQLLVN